MPFVTSLHRETEPLIATLCMWPVVPEHQDSSWSYRLGLSSCTRLLQYRINKAGVTESPKEQPLGMEQKASKGPFWSGLSQYPIQIWERVSKMVLPKK